ncbi:MAG: hypothetical protein BMS9Abin30_0910 [Gammaproteobacteria bacterium]|nr:MAG: hypothetical protein BMS9Abin30_0910 [Gammaproteobacteria bacterium]
MNKYYQFLATAVATIALSLVSFNAGAVVINNGLATSQQGYWSVDVLDGGETRTANLTGTGTPSGTVFQDEEIIFDYFSYVDAGSGGVRLSATTIVSAASVTNPGEVTSTGNFLGSAGNIIDWVMVSTIIAGSSILTNELTLTARTGTLGALDFYQYLDEDVLGSGDDFFFTRGSTGSNLELFTIDNAEAIGVSHSGAQSGGQGLVNSNFSGWAADVYNNIKPMISAGTQAVSPVGVISASLAAVAANHPVAGAGYGPTDIVSVVAWDMVPAATAATVLTTLGGVPNINVVSGEPIPVPALDIRMLALLTLLLGVGGVIAIRRQIS